MEREIKFRGLPEVGEWSQKYGMIEGSLIIDNEQHSIRISGLLKAGDEYTDEFVVIPETVGQYTEFSCSNDVEIFGGDTVDVIVSVFIGRHFNGKDLYDDITIRGVVTMEQGAWMVGQTRITEGSDKHADEPYSVVAPTPKLYNSNTVVIGNIHQHPELLTPNKEEDK